VRWGAGRADDSWDKPLIRGNGSPNGMPITNLLTLDAMLGAAREYFPVFRRYLKTKAHALGLPRLAWYDLFAPMAEGNKAWSYNEANQFIVEQFKTFTPRLSAFAARANSR
jgi:oligoendopeptidase F